MKEEGRGFMADNMGLRLAVVWDKRLFVSLFIRQSSPVPAIKLMLMCVALRIKMTRKGTILN